MQLLLPLLLPSFEHAPTVTFRQLLDRVYAGSQELPLAQRLNRLGSPLQAYMRVFPLQQLDFLLSLLLKQLFNDLLPLLVAD